MARAYLGVFGLLFIAWLCSENRRDIRWRTVAGGVVLQFAAALLLIGVPGANRVMFWLNDAASALHRATEAGTVFVFGYLAGPPLPFVESHPGASFILAFQALPLVLTISALASLLFHWGVLQFVTGLFARLLRQGCVGHRRPAGSGLRRARLRRHDRGTVAGSALSGADAAR